MVQLSMWQKDLLKPGKTTRKPWKCIQEHYNRTWLVYQAQVNSIFKATLRNASIFEATLRNANSVGYSMFIMQIVQTISAGMKCDTLEFILMTIIELN